MTATQDLQDVSDAIDGALHGWLYPESIKGTTVRGQECLRQVVTIRSKLYSCMQELSSTRYKLDNFESTIDGEHAMNELLTNQVEELEKLLKLERDRNARLELLVSGSLSKMVAYRDQIAKLEQSVSDAETRIIEGMARNGL